MALLLRVYGFYYLCCSALYILYSLGICPFSKMATILQWHILDADESVPYRGGETFLCP